MRAGVSSRGSTWVSMGCLGWLILGPFVLAWYVLRALGIVVAGIYRAITGAVREARPEPTAAKLERQAARHRVAGIVVLSLCAVVFAVCLAATVFG